MTPSKLSSQIRRLTLACVLLATPAAFAQDAPEATEETPSSVKIEASGPSAKDIAKDIVRDQKQIWTSPFRITRRNAKWWLIFGGVTGFLIATDHRSSQQLPNTGDQLAFSRDVSRLGSEYTLIPIAGGFLLGGILTNQSKLRDTGLLGAEALVDGLIVSEVLKTATRRQRPTEGDGGMHFFHGSDAFPSGHTLESFALASVVARQYHDNKAIVILAYSLATLAGASRFSARQHSASDIVAGAAMGWFIGRHVFERGQDGRRSLAKARLFPQVIPQVQPSDHSYGLLLAWRP